MTVASGIPFAGSFTLDWAPCEPTEVMDGIAPLDIGISKSSLRTVAAAVSTEIVSRLSLNPLELVLLGFSYSNQTPVVCSDRRLTVGFCAP